MKFLKQTTNAFLVAFLMIGTATFAQNETSVSDEELTQFATAFQSVQQVSMQAQGEMMEVIQASGLEVQRFNELYNEAQSAEGDTPASATEEEAKKYQGIMGRIEALQPTFEHKMDKAIADAGMTSERYEEIMMVIQSDPEMQQKVQSMMQQ